jgi:hypothetical protein
VREKKKIKKWNSVLAPISILSKFGQIWSKKVVVGLNGLTLLINVWISSSESKRVVSSAKRSEKRFVHFGRSFIYIRKRIGPRMEPCGTPLSIFSKELEILFIETNWFLFER